MKNIFLVIKKELKEYFISPIAYVVIAAFLVVIGIIYTKDLFIDNEASMRSFFEVVPLIFIIVIPALTMRSWAEERKAKTLEIISTLPITEVGLIFAKFCSCLLFTIFTLLLTFPIPLTLNILGDPDNGVIIAGYFGLILLIGGYIAIGQFISINTTNQIVAFILASVLIAMLYVFSEVQFLLFVPSSFRVIFESLGTGSHFRSIAKGVLDSRDILYFLSIIALMFYFTHKSLVRIKTKGQ